VTESTPRFFARLSLALGTFLRLLLDRPYAARVAQLREPQGLRLPELKPAIERVELAPHAPRDLGPALQLLMVLQREGRLIDFVQQDIATFADADVGAAARVVHLGCRRALEQTLVLEPIRSEAEGCNLLLEAGFDPKAYRLVGNVQGQPPYHGKLRHRGWRVKDITLEEPLATAALTIVAPAEVEL
jgi:hypothetical protein